jgi:ribonuclease VapC
LILDSSAVVAVLREEPGYAEIERSMQTADRLEIGAPTLVECVVVMGRVEGEVGVEAVFDLLRRVEIEVLSFDEPHAEVAGEAFLDFGKGRHPARLNYGDCMTYATAQRADRPLLVTGEDFAQTDIHAA